MTVSGNDASLKHLRVLALVEADVVTGAAKSLLDFCRAAREHALSAPDEVQVGTAVLTFVRRPGATKDEVGGDAPPPNLFVAAARAAGLTVDLIPERFRFDPRVLPALRQAVARHDPHVVVSYHVKSHFLVKASGLWRRRPWIAFHHGYTSTDLKMLAYNQLDRWSLPTADRVLTVCEAFARDLSRRKGVRPERLRVQHNSIRREYPREVAVGRAFRQRFGITDDERVVVAIGRLSREKAHADLIEAAALWRHTHPGLKARLLIVGDGPERERLDQLAAKLGVNEMIVYAGQLTDPRPAYAAAEVMVLPSHSEGSPFVLLEAMAAGLPVVATAVGGVPEMVRHEESALLVEPHRPAQLAAALGRVLQEPGLAEKISAGAAALVETRYSPETYFATLAELYAEVARLRRP